MAADQMPGSRSSCRLAPQPAWRGLNVDTLATPMGILTSSHRKLIIRSYSNNRKKEMDTKAVIDALGALANDHRLAVYRLLVQAGHGGLSAGVIAERLGIPPSSLSFHTQALVRSGLATQHRVSRQLIYTADFTIMNKLLGYLSENCCQGDTERCQPAEKVITGPQTVRKEENVA